MKKIALAFVVGVTALFAPQAANADITVFSTSESLEPMVISAPAVVGDSCSSTRILSSPVTVTPMSTCGTTSVLTHPVTIERTYSTPAVIDRRFSAPVIIEHDDDDDHFIELNTPLLDINLL